MTRALSALALAAALALPVGAMAQTPAPTPRTAIVNSVQINSVTATPVAPGPRATDTREGLLNKLRNAQPAMPSMTLPPSQANNG